MTSNKTTQIITVWITSINASISVISSYIIIYMVLKDRETKLKSPNNRILLFMSTIDIFNSLGFMASSLPMPRESGYYGAIGTPLSCSIQGFILQLGMAVPCYNASLCIWFLYSIKHNMTARKFKQRIEPYCHAISIAYPVLSAVLFTVLGKFGTGTGNLCWATAEKTFLDLFLTSLCTPLFPSFLVIVYCLVSIHLSFVEKERKLRRYSTSDSGMEWRPNHILQSKKISAEQGRLFSFAYFITFFFPVMNAFLFTNHASSPLDIPQAFFLPLQGFWNLVIYCRRSVKRIIKEYPDLTVFNAVNKMIFHPEEVRPLHHESGRGGTRRRRSSLHSNISQINQNHENLLLLDYQMNQKENKDTEKLTQQNIEKKDSEMEDTIFKQRGKDTEEMEDTIFKQGKVTCVDSNVQANIKQAMEDSQEEDVSSS